jgi:hypothetical protein
MTDICAEPLIHLTENGIQSFICSSLGKHCMLDVFHEHLIRKLWDRRELLIYGLIEIIRLSAW